MHVPGIAPAPPSSRHLRTERSLKSSQASAVADGSCRVGAVLGREHRRGGFGAAQARLKQHEHDRAVEPGESLEGHPRVGGEHTSGTDVSTLLGGSSPRGWGTRPQCRENDGQRRVIPRVGGEHEELLELSLS